MTESDVDRPENIPAAVAEAIEDSDDSQLRAIVRYAQQHLRDHPSLSEEIDAREGEELVRIEDHEGYRLVVVKRPGETGDERGPFAYRVTWEPPLAEGEGTYRWHYLGRVDTGGGD